VSIPTWLKPERAVCNIKRQLKVPFAMDIIILMARVFGRKEISWIFNNKDPQTANCLNNFKKEFAMVIHRAKGNKAQEMKEWLLDLA
jgi:hypothetical protein